MFFIGESWGSILKSQPLVLGIVSDTNTQAGPSDSSTKLRLRKKNSCNTYDNHTSLKHNSCMAASPVHPGFLTVSEGEAVDERQTIKPVVVLGGAHREETGPVSQQGALQP